MLEITLRPLSESVDIQQGRYLSKEEMQDTKSTQCPIPVHGANGIIGWTSQPMYADGVPLVTCRGSNSGMVLWADGPLWVSNNAMAVTPKEGDNRFLFYSLLNSPPYSVVTGSAQPQITRRDLVGHKIAWTIPPVQEAIASVLGALDEKIALNGRMNETLETLARAIFKDWFVDFGPTRAKMEGRAPYLPTDIWSLFPERLDEQGKPVGWTTSTIGQEVDVVGGSTPSTKEAAFWGGDIFWATPKDLSSLNTPVLLSTERQITNAGLEQIGSGLMPAGTVLLSSRAPIGYMAIAQMPVAVNQGFIAMICKRRLSNVFAWLWTQANMATVHQNANGSTFQEISKANFRPIEVIVATPEVLRAFDEVAVPMFERIVCNERESCTLAATRDYLLPRLMAGEIRVGDAAALI